MHLPAKLDRLLKLLVVTSNCQSARSVPCRSVAQLRDDSSNRNVATVALVLVWTMAAHCLVLSTRSSFSTPTMINSQTSLWGRVERRRRSGVIFIESVAALFVLAVGRHPRRRCAESGALSCSSCVDRSSRESQCVFGCCSVPSAATSAPSARETEATPMAKVEMLVAVAIKDRRVCNGRHS